MRMQTVTRRFLFLIAILLPAALPLGAGAQTGWLGEGAVGSYLNSNFPPVSPETTAYRTVRAFPNLEFVDPSAMVADPVEDRFYIAERIGRLYLIDNDEAATEKHLVLDIRPNIPILHDSGFYNFTFDPGFETNGFLYAFYTWKEAETPDAPLMNQGFNDKYLRISRFTVDLESQTIDPQTELVMIQMRLYNLSHRGSGMVFGDDGFLYLSIGELIRAWDAQDIVSTLHGGVLRIDVHQQGGDVSHPPRRRLGTDAGQSDEFSGVRYYIPSDNPFLDEAGGVFEEFYALGTRNPYRMSKDRYTGDIWVADVGDKREEFNLLEKGGNYQWPYIEGSNSENIIWQDFEGHEVSAFYALDRTKSKCLIGGYVYRGNKFPEFEGTYLAGDYVIPSLWAVDLNTATGAASHSFITSFDRLVGFAEDPRHGEIYFWKGNTDGHWNSGIYRLEHVSTLHPMPSLLSDTGAFDDTESLDPVSGLIEFEPASPLWSDGANKRRWIAVPNDGGHNSPEEKVQFSFAQGYTFPVGTTLVKHFELNGRRIETRLLVKDELEEWYGATYRWLEDQSDAALVDPAGLDEVITIGGEEFLWHYPSQAECFTCHTEVNGRVLGFRTSQLNSERDYPGHGARNQLSALNQIALFHVILDEGSLPNFPKSAGLDDANATLDHRVRSYLDSNCAQCHQPGGPDGHATWNALLNVPLENRALIGNPVYEGEPGEWVVVPGMPEASDLIKRLNSLEGCCAMPPLAKNRVDEQAVQQVAAWIREMNSGLWKNWSAMDIGPLENPASADFNGQIQLAVDAGGTGGFQIGDATFTGPSAAGISISSDGPALLENPAAEFGASEEAENLEALFARTVVAGASSSISITTPNLMSNYRYKLQLLMIDTCCDAQWGITVNNKPEFTLSTGEVQENTFDGTRGMVFTHHFVGATQPLEVAVRGNGSVVRLAGFTLENLGLAENTDLDGDGLPDYWEAFHSPWLNRLGAGDQDGDGVSDISEFLSGTDPLDEEDRLKILSVEPGQDSLDVVLDSKLGESYLLEWTTDFLDWNPEEPGFLGNDSETIVRFPFDAASEKEVFFRIRAE